MTGIDSYSTTPATNATADGGAINWSEGQPPSSVNNTARQMLADTRSAFNDLIWFEYSTGDQGPGNLAVPAVYSSGTAFTITGADVTSVYSGGRRVRAVGTSTGTIFGSISSSSYSAPTTTVNVTWDSGGALSNETLVICISQIPATGNPVSFATGSFTPAITLGGGATGVMYTTQVGNYTQLGNRILFDLQITLSAKGSSTGTLKITGLPFTAVRSRPFAIFAQNLDSSISCPMAASDASATTIGIYNFSGGAPTVLSNTTITNTTIILLSGEYAV